MFLDVCDPSSWLGARGSWSRDGKVISQRRQEICLFCPGRTDQPGMAAAPNGVEQPGVRFLLAQERQQIVEGHNI